MSDTASEHAASSDASSDSSEIANMLQHQPMYYVLAQYLETADNKNIATILEELVTEIRGLRLDLKEKST